MSPQLHRRQLVPEGLQQKGRMQMKLVIEEGEAK